MLAWNLGAVQVMVSGFNFGNKHFSLPVLASVPSMSTNYNLDVKQKYPNSYKGTSAKFEWNLESETKMEHGRKVSRENALQKYPNSYRGTRLQGEEKPQVRMHCIATGGTAVNLGELVPKS